MNFTLANLSAARPVPPAGGAPAPAKPATPVATTPAGATQSRAAQARVTQAGVMQARVAPQAPADGDPAPPASQADGFLAMMANYSAFTADASAAPAVDAEQASTDKPAADDDKTDASALPSSDPLASMLAALTMLPPPAPPAAASQDTDAAPADPQADAQAATAVGATTGATTGAGNVGNAGKAAPIARAAAAVGANAANGTSTLPFQPVAAQAPAGQALPVELANKPAPAALPASQAAAADPATATAAAVPVARAASTVASLLADFSLAQDRVGKPDDSALTDPAADATAAIAAPASGSSTSVSATAKPATSLQAAPAQPLMEALGDRVHVQVQQRVEQAVIRLEPPRMGTIEIVIHHEGGVLQVQMNASHSDVQRQLQTLSDALRQDLTQRQYTDVSVSVGSQMGADANGQRRQRQQEEADVPGRALAEADAGLPSSRFTLSALTD
ncbi:MAG: Fe-S oxidoreductase [Rhizobacter sp.]|nr:Fe-S oxidoreductase [Rhizobacter sp.]